tara:strand:- start:18 stop:311 length:294 start_codon:yes stop_codon:yes gene_type:complete
MSAMILRAYPHLDECTIFGVKEITITKSQTILNKDELLTLDWVDREGKDCRVEFFIDGPKSTIHIAKDVRKQLKTIPEKEKEETTELETRVQEVYKV